MPRLLGRLRALAGMLAQLCFAGARACAFGNSNPEWNHVIKAKLFIFL
jgi:hypothetical protein